jgi:hypothetical protein
MGQSGTVARAQGDAAREPASEPRGADAFREDVPETTTRQNICCPKPSEPPRTEEQRAATGPSSEPPPASRRTVRHSASRPAPLRIDEVGGAAMAIDARTRRAPRLAKPAIDASKAPLDPQSAFLLTLVDGQVGVEMLADIAGLTVESATAMLERLERLGLVICH